MTLWLFISVMVGSVIPAKITTKPPARAAELKVITYNIWNGYDWGQDEDRRTRVVSWIRYQHPDVVALQELCGYSEDKLLADAREWGHEYACILKTSGYPVGLTSNQPIQVIQRIRKDMHHGALHCRTHDVEFIVIHFSPSSYKKRREEAGIIISVMDSIKIESEKYIILGDFNAHSPFDADLYPNDGGLINHLRNKEKMTDPGSGNLVNGNLDYAVLSEFLAFPLTDVCQLYTRGLDERGSFPGRVLGPVNGESDEALMARSERIDYILVSPYLAEKCVRAGVMNGPENWYLSDHYPVFAEFKIH